MIQLQDVTKVYVHAQGEVRALDQVNLSVAAGEFVAVRGPSGSGKSTLLLTIGGMIRPSGGQVLVDGEDLYALPAARRLQWRAHRIGFVFQMFHLVPYLTALENMLVTNLAGCRATRGQAQEVLQRLGLGARLAHLPAELSAGERQRVALARALLKQPDIILADEPTGNLDPDSASEVMRTLRDFHAAGGTVVVVSHDEQIASAAQRTLRLEAGRLSPT